MGDFSTILFAVVAMIIQAFFFDGKILATQKYFSYREISSFLPKYQIAPFDFHFGQEGRRCHCV